MKKNVTVRRFLRGADEAIWTEILNAEYQEYRSWWRGTTADEMLELEKQPGFDSDWRFVSEFNEKPVGVIHARVEQSSSEKNGFIRDFCVVPSFRGHGVEESLLQAAVAEFKKHGVNIVRAWTGIKRPDRIQFLERSGFRFAYRTIDMRINFANMPSNIIGNSEVSIRRVEAQKNSDIEAINWLANECFRGNPIVPQKTVEETRQSLLNNTVCVQQECFFAVFGRRNVGYICVEIDEKYNAEHEVKSGFIKGIGVLPTHRKKGIGTRLMLHGLQALKTRGMTSATLDTEDNNPTKAMTLYEQLGFKVLQEYVTYTKQLRA